MWFNVQVHQRFTSSPPTSRLLPPFGVQTVLSILETYHLSANGNSSGASLFHHLIFVNVHYFTDSRSQMPEKELEEDLQMLRGAHVVAMRRRNEYKKRIDLLQDLVRHAEVSRASVDFAVDELTTATS